MIGILRNSIIIILLLSLIYLALSYTARRNERIKLRAAYRDAGPAETIDEFVDKGLIQHQRSSCPKLIVMVFLIPMAIISLLIYLAHHS